MIEINEPEMVYIDLNTEYPFLCLRICGVYKITNKINLKSYIGSSKNVILRLLQHLEKSSSCFLRADMKKYGRDNFTMSILEEVLNINELRVREQYYINLYEACKATKGYNVARIGQVLEHLKHEDVGQNVSASKTINWTGFKSR